MDKKQVGEDGLLFEATIEKGKLTAKSRQGAVEDIKRNKTAEEGQTNSLFLNPFFSNRL